MVKDSRFYSAFFRMAIVLVLQNVITLSVNLADNIMLGAYSEISLSGVTAVNQIQFIYQQLLSAAGEGIVILGSQYFGQQKYEPMRKLTTIAMRFALALCICLFALVSLCPHLVLTAFTPDEAIISEGMRYINIIRFTYVFFAITQILLATLRSRGIVRIALGLSVWALICNCCINYTLIYGHFGAPEMGVAGAAIGTLVARITELIILCIFIIRRDSSILTSLKKITETDRLLTRDYFKVVYPILVVSGLWGLNTAMQNMILGHMGDGTIAANSVASNMFLLVKSMAVGTSSTAAFFIAKTIGEGNEQLLKSYAKTMQVLFVLVGLLSGAALFLIRIPILSLYHLSPDTMRMANSFLLILCFVIVTMSYQMPTNTGIIKGGGDTVYVMIMDIVSIWGIVIPISFVMAFVVKASPIIVLCCLNADQVFKCIPAFIKCNFGHWAKKLTR